MIEFSILDFRFLSFDRAAQGAAFFLNAIVFADGAENIEHAARRQGRAAVHDAAGDERDHAGFEHNGFGADGELETALHHIGDLLVRMLVQRDRDAGLQRDFADGDAFKVSVVAADGAAEDFPAGREARVVKLMVDISIFDS